jgi:hypothetical protein
MKGKLIAIAIVLVTAAFAVTPTPSPTPSPTPKLRRLYLLTPTPTPARIYTITPTPSPTKPLPYYEHEDQIEFDTIGPEIPRLPAADWRQIQRLLPLQPDYLPYLVVRQDPVSVIVEMRSRTTPSHGYHVWLRFQGGDWVKIESHFTTISP